MSEGTHSSTGTTGLTVLMGLYTIFRMLFTLCYLFALQPLRSIFFVLGQICFFLAAIIMCVAAYDCQMNVAFPSVK
jgi:uncharacterized MAPEG superfamily protein